VTTLLLIHGGLWDEDADAGHFWHQPGIVAGLQRYGFVVLAPSRLQQAPDWATEASHLARSMPRTPVTVLAGSNGCSAAARLALDFPGAVTRLLLAWPATAGDPAVDTRTRSHLAGLGASPKIIDTLLAGQTLRGTTDAELDTLKMPVGVLPSIPANPFHQWHTTDALLRLLRAEELTGCPEPPRPEFPPHLGSFLGTVATFTAKQPRDDNYSDSCDI
jgi:pimeloyl-ACP methyl ester carboxylesterase